MKRWLSFRWQGFRCFLRFIKRLPKYFWLNQFWDCEPDFYPWVINQYSEVMCEMTGGKLSKPSHDAKTVITYAWDYIDEEYGHNEHEDAPKTEE